MGVLLKIGSWLGKRFSSLETGLALASEILIVLAMFLVTGEIVGRYFFNFPIPGQVEIVELMMGMIAFLAIAHTERVGAHLRVSMLMNRLKGRWYNTAEVLYLLLSLAAVSLISVYSMKYSLGVRESNTTTDVLWLPIWPFTMMVSFGCGLLCIRFLIELSHHARLLVKGGQSKKDSEIGWSDAE